MTVQVILNAVPGLVMMGFAVDATQRKENVLLTRTVSQGITVTSTQIHANLKRKLGNLAPETWTVKII